MAVTEINVGAAFKLVFATSLMYACYGFMKFLEFSYRREHERVFATAGGLRRRKKFLRPRSLNETSIYYPYKHSYPLRVPKANKYLAMPDVSRSLPRSRASRRGRRRRSHAQPVEYGYKSHPMSRRGYILDARRSPDSICEYPTSMSNKKPRGFHIEKSGSQEPTPRTLEKPKQNISGISKGMETVYFATMPPTYLQPSIGPTTEAPADETESVKSETAQTKKLRSMRQIQLDNYKSKDSNHHTSSYFGKNYASLECRSNACVVDNKIRLSEAAIPKDTIQDNVTPHCEKRVQYRMLPFY